MVDLGNDSCELIIHLPAYGSHQPNEIRGLANAAVDQGADGICFFCHDFFDEPMVEALKNLKWKVITY